ncbi:MAG: DUF4339 domain-containing protein, partial [Limisphaerales bacterium]
NKEGPYSLEDLSQRVHSGQLSKTTLAWHEGLSNWMPVLAVITPRAKPPIFKHDTANLDAVEPDRQRFDYKEIFNQSRAIGWRKILPIDFVKADKPWNILWVRWLLALVGFLFLIRMLATHNEITNKQALFLLTVTWATACVIGFWSVLRPQQLRIKHLFLVTLCSTSLAVLFFVLSSKLEFLSSVFQATSSSFFLKRSSACLVLALLLNLFVTAPLFFLVRRNRIVASTDILFCGVVAGMAVGLAPLLTNVLQQKWQLLNGRSFGVLDNQPLLLMFTWPILSSLWSGIASSFICAAHKNKELAYGWVAAGLGIATLLCSMYLTFSVSWIGFVAVIISIIGFAAYTRLHTTEVGHG